MKIHQHLLSLRRASVIAFNHEAEAIFEAPSFRTWDQYDKSGNKDRNLVVGRLNRIFEMMLGVEDVVVLCEHYERPAISELTVSTHSGLTISEQAYEDDFFTSDNSGNVYPTSRMVEVCEEDYPDGSRTWLISRDEAVFADWRWSERVSRWIHDTDWDDEQHAEEEPDDSDERSNGRLDYSTDIMDLRVASGPFSFDGRGSPEPGKIYLGVELETENRSGLSIASTVEMLGEEVKKFAILKEDSSLEYGIEIVSVPMSIDRQFEAWGRFFGGDAISRLDTSYRTGLHVHVSRAPLGELNVAKLLWFICGNENDREHHRFLDRLAGRSENGYCARQRAHFQNRKNPYGHITLRDKKVNYGIRGAMSTMTDQDTVEFRLFASTLNQDTFRMRLEFVRSLISFVTVTPIAHANHVNFLAWFSKAGNRKSYPHLANFLVQEKQLAPFTKKKPELLDLAA